MTSTQLLISFTEKCGITPITQAQAHKLLRFGELVLDTNKLFNLVGDVDMDTMLSKHIADSLAGAKYVGEHKRVLDVGTGAGFPGMPLAIALPHVQFTLMDATEKKIHFIASAVKELGLTNVTPVCARAEEAALSKYRESFDGVISRAVAPMVRLCEYTVPFIKVGGRLLAYKGPRIHEEYTNSDEGLKRLGVVRSDIISLPSLNNETEHLLALVNKVSPTPKSFPRTNAQIMKKPLW